MTYSLRAFACLSLLTVYGCCGAPVVQTKLVEIPIPQKLPKACSDLPPLELPDGTTAQGVIEAQHAHILALEGRITACATVPASVR